MKKLLFTVLMLSSIGANSQTTIYSEDFTTGSTWTLNTVLGSEGGYPNNWYISCQEDGQSAGSCGTACSIMDNSLHVSANAILGDLGAAYFEGLGTSTNRRAASGNISTIGESGLTLSFDMIGAGNASDFTELFYSIDGGANWISLDSYLTSLCCGGVACTGTLQGLWQTNTYTLPASCENIPNLRIAFVWQNLDDGIATDPSFAVDDIVITSVGSPATSITTGTVNPSSWCYGTTITGALNFEAIGTYGTGNVYTAEMSDATGSFAMPTTVGTLASSSSGPLSINVAIPGSMPAGTGYRIRVVASAPATTGTDNGSDIIIYGLPTVTLGAYTDVCIYTPFFTLTGGTPTGGTYSGPGVAAGAFDPAAAGLGPHTITYSYTDGNGCAASASETILVDACAALSEQENDGFRVHPNPASGSFLISLEGKIDGVELTDLAGKNIKTFEEKMQEYDVRDVPPGVYLIKVRSNKKTITLRLLIE